MKSEVSLYNVQKLIFCYKLKTPYLYFREKSILPFREVIFVECRNDKEHVNTISLCGRNAEFSITTGGRAETERDGTRAETRFGFPAKRTSPFISAGVSVQSAAGSRGVRISGSNAGQTVSDTVHDCWLPPPFAFFPFTSPPVRFRVPSHSISALHIYCASYWLIRYSPLSFCAVIFRGVFLPGEQNTQSVSVL